MRRIALSGMDITEYLRHTEGVASRRRLLASGFTDRRIAAAVRAARIHRVRPGWFALPGGPARLRAAVAAGGRVSCASALALRGVWILDENGLHVSVPDGSHRRSRPGCRIHHRVLRSSGTPGLVESPIEALEQIFHCASPIETVIAVDSALDKGLIVPSQLEPVFGRSRRGRWVREHADGRSQSGTETIVRLALRRRRVRLRPQVTVPGVGRVDIVVGDRLEIELDSRTWHDNPEAYEQDRRRDLALVVLGFVVVRLSYRRVIEDWDAVEADLLTLIRRGEHRWRGSRAEGDAGTGSSTASPA
jgi:very-short-patch-repair endonuclease